MTRARSAAPRGGGGRRRVLLVLVIAGVVCAGLGGVLLLRSVPTGGEPARYSIRAGDDRYSPSEPARLLSSPGAGLVLLVAGTGMAVAGVALLRRRAVRDATRS